jgi:hypothetical protein
MNRQLVTVTALPNGVASNGRLRLSAFVSPFLQPEGGGQTSLDHFPDWLDWPSRQLTFMAQFGSADAVAATRVGDAPRSDLWKALFDGSAQVGHPELVTASAAIGIQDTSDGPAFDSYDTRFLHQWLKDAYVRTATRNAEEFPSGVDLREVGPFADLLSSLEDDWDHAQEGEGEGLGALAADPDEVRGAFDALRRFHAPFSKKPAQRPSEAELRFDFHEVLTGLSHYPALMRLLGLVHDLEVGHPGDLGTTTVQVLVSWTPVGSEVDTVVAPRVPGPRLATRCLISSTKFHAVPKASDPELSSDGRMLPLDDADRFEVVQIDQDGAAIRSFNFAEQLIRHVKTATDDTPDAYALPALSSTGFAVARVARAAALTTAFGEGASKNQAVMDGQDVTLDAEDVTRGYAIDVWDDTSRKWRSLCERVGTYSFTNPSKPITLSGIADEGWISGSVASAARGAPVDEGASPPRPRLPETLFQWFGWSLAANRPGKYADLDGNLRAMDNQPGPQWPFAANFTVAPGSLPRLRFGTQYQLRARAVDLAGNRLSRSEATAEHATGKQVYGRFDPIVSPEVVPQSPLTEGESTQRLIIRSNFNSAMIAPSRRHTIPPKAAEPMVEAHGVFDKSSGVLDSSGYGTIQSLDGVTIDMVGKPDPNAPGSVYLDGMSTSTPYMPDLLSRGAMLRGLPGASGPLQISFGYTEGVKWPKPKPFLLQLVEGSGPPTFDKGKRLLTVKLPKAEVVTSRISSYLVAASGDVDRLGLLRWLEEAGVGPAELDEFRQLAAEGRHWMVTPWRDLTFVHAVRQPLIRPKYSAGFSSDRELGDTFTTLSDAALELSRKSTVTVDIVARWTEILDALAEPGPLTANGNARPFRVQVPLAGDPADESKLAIEGRHEFGDTKYRRINYSAIATSRFGEYFAQRLRGVTLTGAPFLVGQPVTDDGENLGGVVAGSDSVTASDGSRTFQRDVDYVIDYLSGKLTPTTASPLIGATADILFTAPPITRKAAQPVALDVLNAARPDAPKVLYAIPTFGWSASVNREATNYQSRRLGMGLRVYLDRPWYSSGDGERLGVVIWSGSSAPTGVARAMVSEWGLDPLFLSAPTAEGPTVEAFRLADATQKTGLTLAETDLPAGAAIHVAGHSVAYDTERRLWYADLEINAGTSYFPFVRLALARFQPKSLNDAHLSRVVRADFVQLAPDRAVTITRAKASARELTVTVAGPGYSRAAKDGRPSRIEVSVEKKRANTDLSIAQELGWEEAPGSTVVLDVVSGSGSDTVWRKNLTLPAGPSGGFRVIVREIELLNTGRRAVYADAIVI